jgi:hypothetical protein
MSTRDVSHETPLLFDKLPPAAVPSVLEVGKDEKGTDKLARDFVRWCFSFGNDFRNSPDVTNLRYWAQKTNSKIEDEEESEILQVARPLFFKRIEQLTRKAEAPN